MDTLGTDGAAERIRSFSYMTLYILYIPFISYNVSYTDAESLGYLFPHDHDFSEQTTISADSKIINSGRAAVDREPSTRGRYITSRVESMPRRFHVLPPSPYSASDDVEEAPLVFAVQTSRAKKPGLRTTAEKIKQSAQ